MIRIQKFGGKDIWGTNSKISHKSWFRTFMWHWDLYRPHMHNATIECVQSLCKFAQSWDIFIWYLCLLSKSSKVTCFDYLCDHVTKYGPFDFFTFVNIIDHFYDALQISWIISPTLEIIFVASFNLWALFAWFTNGVQWLKALSVIFMMDWPKAMEDMKCINAIIVSHLILWSLDALWLS